MLKVLSCAIDEIIEILQALPMIVPLHKYIPREEFDYQTLLDVLKDYSRPRDKISDLMRKRIIVRIKKGLYIFGDDYRRRPFSREVLANLIYGPSYISLETALQHYGLIPEQVYALTSVTTGRSTKFNTPVGLFTYHRIPLKAYRFGMTRVEADSDDAYLIATAEKALCDKIRLDRGAGIKSRRQMRIYLEDNLRIDLAALEKINPANIIEIAERYRSRALRILAELIN